MFSQFKDWAENRHEYARKWKEEKGGKVVGYLCTYAPEEIMYAAGILPVRILGGHEPTDLAEPHIFGMYCPFCRDCLAQGLKGKYNYLDGIMIAHSCLHIRNTYSSWKLNIPHEFDYYLPFPNHVQSPRAVPYLTEELRVFKKKLEDWLGKQITDDDLEEAIEVYDKNRRLMRQVYEMRRSDAPPLTGTEALYMVLASQIVDKKDHNSVLEKVVSELPSRKLDREVGIRLMIVTSENDDPKFVEMVEGIGATVVMDEACVGSRYFWNETPKEGSPLERIARRYVDRPRCPSKDWPRRDRLAFITQAVKDYQVQGAILVQQKFCDPHEFDIPIIKRTLEDMGVKTYFLECDVTIPYGQFRIRLEAFKELFEQDLLFA